MNIYNQDQYRMLTNYEELPPVLQAAAMPFKQRAIDLANATPPSSQEAWRKLWEERNEAILAERRRVLGIATPPQSEEVVLETLTEKTAREVAEKAAHAKRVESEAKMKAEHAARK